MTRVVSRPSKTRGQRGYVLLSIMLLITLMLLVLTIELPRIAQQIKREKEEELIHRGNEYKIAVRKFFRKFGRYPLSIDQLENTNNMRFLRRRWKDPFTGKDDWRLLHPGEVQVNVGPPQGQGGPGQPAGQISSSIGQPTPFGSNQAGGFAANNQASPLASNQPAGAAPITANASPFGQPAGAGNQGDPAQGNAGATGVVQGIGGLSTGAQPGAGPIIGVSSISKLQSIKEINGKNHYNDWPFAYDPRQELQMPPGSQAGAINPAGGSAPGQFNPPGGQMNPSGQINPGGPGQMNPPPNPPPPGPRQPQ